jgi:hypothetical protein
MTGCASSLPATSAAANALLDAVKLRTSVRTLVATNVANL